VSQKVSNFFKIKLKKALFEPVKNVFSEDEFLQQESLAPLKEIKADMYVE